MTVELPTPLTPIECDLRDYVWMPIDVNRLLSSETWILASAEEKVAAFTLWARSWHEVPAGSLPDNDKMLAHLSGAGSAWKKVRAHALRGWIKCSDGRIYHTTVSAKACESWQIKLTQRHRTAAARETLAARREAERLAQIERMRASNSVTDPATGAATGSVTEAVTENVTNSTVQYPTIPNLKEAVATDGEAAPNPTPSKIHQPRRSDPPHRWASIAEGWEVDQKMVRRPVVCGEYFDLLADQVLAAAGITDLHWTGDWGPIIGWLKAGLSGADIIASVRQVAARQNYKPAMSLKYFDAAVREFGVGK